MLSSLSKRLIRLSQPSRQLFSSQEKDGKIRVPTQNTSSEAFAKKFTEREIEKFLDPMGFLKKEEIADYDVLNSAKKKDDFEKILKDQKPPEKKVYTSPNVKSHINEMEPEYGFKAKGPEPTRYGDWEKKGRVSDF